MSLTTRQQEIVRNSIRIIAQQGIQELTIKHIALAIGVTEAALYRHFKSKNDILLSVLDYFEEVSSEIIADVENRGQNPLHKIELFITNRYRLFTSNPDLAKVMFSEVLFENDAILSQKMQKIIQTHMHQVFAYFDQAQQQGLIRNDIEHEYLFRMIIGSMRLLVTQWCLSNFSFPLVEKGNAMWQATLKVLR